MEYKDYYKIMGVKKDVSPEELKRTYRTLARKYHPDVSKEPNAENKFKELGEAYEVLKDPQKRAQYDQYGEHWQRQAQQQSQGQSQQTHRYSENIDASGFEEFINSIFRQRQQQQSHHYNKGNDIHAKLTISLQDSFLGNEKTLQLRNSDSDYSTRAIKVKIPPGITNKQSIRLRGQGEKGRNGVAGDLYIEVTIAPHPGFKVDNKNVYTQLLISPWEAALGATIAVPTLAGTVNLKIPKLSQSGKQMRLKERGLPGNPPGDQVVTLKIVIPTTDNGQMTALYQQMAEIADFNPRLDLGGNHD